MVSWKLELEKILEIRINQVKEMVRNDNYENSEFERKYSKIKNILGEDDRDLFLVDMDLQIKKGRKNAESR